MADGKDNNGMIPQNWKDADTSKIQSVQVKSKDNNIELFDGIKTALANAVISIRGDANDDKVKYIVYLIMLRVRGAIEAQLNANNDIILQKIEEIIKTNTPEDNNNTSIQNLVTITSLSFQKIPHSSYLLRQQLKMFQKNYPKAYYPLF